MDKVKSHTDNLSGNLDQVELSNQLRANVIPTDAVAAIHALAASGSKTAIAPLVQALSYSYPSVSTAAVAGLVQLAPDSVEPLIAAFHASVDHGVQAYIVQALAQIGDPRSVGLLIEVVGVEVANHCQGNVRRVAARGLGKVASTSGEPQIIQAAVEKLTWALLKAEDWALRYAAVVSLQEIASAKLTRAVSWEAIATSLQQARSCEQEKVVQARIQAALKMS